MRIVLPLPPPPPPPSEPTDPTPFWDAIFQNSYDFVLVADATGRMEYINRTLPGIRPEDVLGTYPEKHFKSPSRERVRAAINRVVETGTPQRLDADFTAPDGAEYTFEAKVAPLGEGRPPTRLLFNYHDISRRKRLENEIRLRETEARNLRATKRLYETVLNCLPDSVTLCDPAGVILTANRAAARLRGFDSAADLLADVETVFDLAHPEDRDRVAREADQALDRADRSGIEYRSITRTGEPIPMEFRAIRILDDNGNPFRIVCISRDLREQKAAEARERDREEKLNHVARLASLGVLIAGMAHEINNPNHAIQSNAQALRNIWNGVLPVVAAHVEKEPDFRVGAYGFSDLRRQMTRAFSNIQESCERISGVVTDLKEYSRPGNYRRNQLLDLSAVIGRSVRLMEPLLKKASFDVRVELDETPPVIGNGQRLEQVVVNLLQNACIAMDGKPGAVRIQTRRGETGETVEIRVEDDGPGIPEENRKRIVEPFFTTRREYGGMGLGLAVSDKIVRDHEGKLVFENREGVGARARVILPVAQRDDPSLDENGFSPEPSEQDELDS
ncbi:MAG: PAS domain-containing protein [Desulfococcaceae bacterium]